MRRNLALAVVLFALTAVILLVLNRETPPAGTPSEPVTITVRESGTLNNTASSPGSWEKQVDVPAQALQIYVSADWYGRAPISVVAISPNGTVIIGSGPPNYPFATIHVDQPLAGPWRILLEGQSPSPQRFNVKIDVTSGAPSSGQGH